MYKKGGSLPSSSYFALSFFAPAFSLLHFHFKHFLLAYSSSQVEGKKNTKKKKFIEEKKMQIREGVYFQAPTLPSHFWFLLLPFRSKHFLLTFLLFKKKKKKTQ